MSGSRDVAFRAVAEGQQAAYGRDQVDAPPRLVVAGDPAARTELGRLVGRGLSGDVLVGVFQGGQRTGGHGVRVRSIRVEGGAVQVTAEFARPGPDAIVTQVLTSPFAVVDVSRADLPVGRTRFVLRDASGREIDRSEVDLAAR